MAWIYSYRSGRLNQLMRRRNLLKLLICATGLLSILFGFGQAMEVFHSMEEAPHTSHHRHTGTVFHATQPCDSGEHHSHLCIHSQLITPAESDSNSVISTSRQCSQINTIEAPELEPFHLFLLRAPPLNSWTFEKIQLKAPKNPATTLDQEFVSLR